MRFLGEHEARRPRERIEARLGERAQLVFAVAIGEIREHEEREPIGGLLVERAQDPRVVGIARASREQRFGLLAAVAAEIRMQQIHHRPQVSAFFHVHLKQVAQIVE